MSQLQFSAPLSQAHQEVARVLAQSASGVMAATLATIAYAYLCSDEGLIRGRLLMKGLEADLIAWSCVMVFGLLYLVADAWEAGAVASQRRRIAVRAPGAGRMLAAAA